MMMLSGVAYGQDSDPNAKWLLTPPTDNIANIADLGGTTNKVSRHQTVYFPVYQHNTTATTAQTVQDGALVECNTAADPGCASAPLFIDAEKIMLCYNPELGAITTASGGNVSFWLCSDSTCTAKTSNELTNLSTSLATGSCIYVGTQAQSVNMVGGSWIYIDVTVPPDTEGDTYLLWAVGTE